MQPEHTTLAETESSSSTRERARSAGCRKQVDLPGDHLGLYLLIVAVGDNSRADGMAAQRGGGGVGAAAVAAAGAAAAGEPAR